MKPAAVARAEGVLGTEAETWGRVARTGWGVSEHWTIGFADGRRAFVKTGSVDPIPAWLRDERDVFEAISGPFMPGFLGFEDGDEPLLVLEELMPAHWPPPWRAGDVALVLETLAEVSALRPRFRRLETVLTNGWRRIEADPAPFLSTGLRDEAWLERMLPELVAAADAVELHGDALVHGDVRSDNLCIKDGRCVLVDWNHACIGNPKLDVAFWAPSLKLERGPEPSELGVDEWAPFVAGFFASLAGLPKPAGAPTVRDFQRAQAAVALDWLES